MWINSILRDAFSRNTADPMITRPFAAYSCAANVAPMLIPSPAVYETLTVFLVLAHDRRRIQHFGVTAHPTAEWTAQQLREAFPWETAPRYLLRDRDRSSAQTL